MKIWKSCWLQSPTFPRYFQGISNLFRLKTVRNSCIDKPEGETDKTCFADRLSSLQANRTKAKRSKRKATNWVHEWNDNKSITKTEKKKHSKHSARRSLSCPITVCKIRNDFPPVVQAEDRQEMWTYLQFDVRNRFSWPLLKRQRGRSRHRAVIIACLYLLARKMFNTFRLVYDCADESIGRERKALENVLMIS